MISIFGVLASPARVRTSFQGRGIFDNLHKSMSYIIAVHLAIVGMSLFRR